MESDNNKHVQNGTASIENTKEDSNSHINITNDIDPEEDKKLKGDAIGDTLYSERFVLKTLLKISEYQWNEELESDMCTIWDMTTDKDVVDFLLNNNFIEMSVDIIKETEELRLSEILVGIIGNMCVYPEPCLKVMAGEHIDCLLSLINVADSPLLAQFMRLYKALLFSNKVTDLKILFAENLFEQINFILQSSQNTELLLYTIQVVAEVISRSETAELNIKLEDINFFNSCNEAFKEITKNGDDTLQSNFEKGISAYLKVLQNYCSVLDNLHETEKIDALSKFSENTLTNTVACIEAVLKLCADSELIHAETETVEYFIYCSANFIVSFRTSFHTGILNLFLDILEIIIENNVSVESDLNGNIVEFLIYVITKTDLDQLKVSFKGWSKNRYKFLLVENVVNKNECNKNFINKVNCLYELL